MRNNDRTERENLAGDEAAVSQLLGDLRRVEAPPDFDIKLRARIANASPVQTQPTQWIPLMKFAVPLCLLLFLVSGFFILNGTFSSDTANAPAASDAGLRQMTVGNSAPPAPVSVAPAEPEVMPVQAPVVERAAISRNERRSSRTRPASAETSGGGSLDRNVIGSSNTIRLPENSNRTSANISKPQTNADISGNMDAAEVLSSIGIDADFVGGELRVREVRAGSRAEGAGIKSGDVVKAVDGRNVSETTSFDTTAGARSLSVVREGKTVNIAVDDK